MCPTVCCAKHDVLYCWALSSFLSELKQSVKRVNACACSLHEELSAPFFVVRLFCTVHAYLSKGRQSSDASAKNSMHFSEDLLSVSFLRKHKSSASSLLEHGNIFYHLFCCKTRTLRKWPFSASIFLAIFFDIPLLRELSGHSLSAVQIFESWLSSFP